jgi:putative component of toxin-antitoxin plasmid stabilization module
VYFIEQDNVLLLFGGNKKTQDKDIKKAKKILKKYNKE